MVSTASPQVNWPNGMSRWSLRPLYPWMEFNNILSHSERQTKHEQQQTEGKRQNGKETRGCTSTGTEMKRELTDKQRERRVYQLPDEFMWDSLHFKNLILERQGQRDNHHKSVQETPSAWPAVELCLSISPETARNHHVTPHTSCHRGKITIYHNGWGWYNVSVRRAKFEGTIVLWAIPPAGWTDICGNGKLHRRDRKVMDCHV